MKKIMKKFLLLFLTLFLVVESKGQIINDNFSTASLNWQGVSLAGTGRITITGGKMNVTADSGSTFAVYNTNVLSGHFYVEVDFGQDDNVGLALFSANGNGSINTNNYSIIRVENVSGVPVVSIADKQNGVSNVLDNSGVLNPIQKLERYRHRLDGNTYSLPFTSTGKKLRILRHANEKFLHFYYYVEKTIDGKNVKGWTELAPSKEWAQLTGNFLMGLVATDGNVSFDNAFAENKALNDVNDSSTGFAATWRELNWSGYSGKALVVTFNSTAAPLTGGTRKFVFWEPFNNVPAWYLDDSLMYTYQFVETWDGPDTTDGAHEPMSDRLLRFSDVIVDYDGADFKIIHWRYVLHDPDYLWPDFGKGTEKPMVDEYYKIYPDGRILRKIRYKAKLDSTFRNWHELSELILISGNVTDPGEHLSTPALSIWPINSTIKTYNPVGSNDSDDFEQSNNDATILAVNLKNHPAVVNVFSDNSSSHETYSGDRIQIQKTWHDRAFHMSHWPINKEPYGTSDNNYFLARTTWKEQIKHASLAGIQAPASINWSNNFTVDPNDGREYREWISYMTLSNDLNKTKTDVQKWLGAPWDLESTSPLKNLALNRPVTSSSSRGSNTGANVVDGSDGTRWESQFTNSEWIYVDLGANYNIDTVVVNWESAYSSAYRIETSNDRTNWVTVYTNNTADGGLDVIDLNPTTVNGRYVRIFGTNRATQFGHSIFEIKVYSDQSLSTVDFSTQSGIKISPNPLSGNNLNVFLDNSLESVYNVQIVTMDGKTVFSEELNINSEKYITLNLSNLCNGLYIVNVKSKSESYSSKIIISR
jgi:F5/8 type C domain/Secretion system C-terminal sorting domain